MIEYYEALLQDFEKMMDADLDLFREAFIRNVTKEFTKKEAPQAFARKKATGKTLAKIIEFAKTNDFVSVNIDSGKISIAMYDNSTYIAIFEKGNAGSAPSGFRKSIDEYIKKKRLAQTFGYRYQNRYGRLQFKAYNKKQISFMIGKSLREKGYKSSRFTFYRNVKPIMDFSGRFIDGSGMEKDEKYIEYEESLIARAITKTLKGI